MAVRKRRKNGIKKETRRAHMKRKTNKILKKNELFNDVTHLFDEYYILYVSGGNGSEIKASTINKIHFFSIIFV
jgi:hypothetical protein